MRNYRIKFLFCQEEIYCNVDFMLEKEAHNSHVLILKEFLVVVTSAAGILGLLLSVSYHLGYFAVFELRLLENLSIADYLSASIPWIIPTLFTTTLIWGLAMHHQLAPSKKSIKKTQNKEREFAQKAPNIQKNILDRENKTLTAGLILLFLLLESIAFCIWYFCFYPKIQILPALILMFPLIVLVEDLVEKKYPTLKNPIYFVTFLMFICFINGAFQAKSLYWKPPNAIIFYKDNTLKQSTISVIKSLSDKLIYLENKKVKILNQENIISLTYNNEE